MTDSKQFAPDMDRLKSELGRTPPPSPSLTTSKPEDYAPKHRSKPAHAPDYTRAEAKLAQAIKFQLRDTEGWDDLTLGEKEALDLIATSMGRICVGRNYWNELAEYAALGEAAKQEP